MFESSLEQLHSSVNIEMISRIFIFFVLRLVVVPITYIGFFFDNYRRYKKNDF